MTVVLVLVKYPITQYLISSISRQSFVVFGLGVHRSVFFTMSASQDLGLLALTGLAFVCMIYVVSPQLFLGLVVLELGTHGELGTLGQGTQCVR